MLLAYGISGIPQELSHGNFGVDGTRCSSTLVRIWWLVFWLLPFLAQYFKTCRCWQQRIDAWHTPLDCSTWQYFFMFPLRWYTEWSRPVKTWGVLCEKRYLKVFFPTVVRCPVFIGESEICSAGGKHLRSCRACWVCCFVSGTLKYVGATWIALAIKCSLIAPSLLRLFLIRCSCSCAMSV